MFALVIGARDKIGGGGWRLVYDSCKMDFMALVADFGVSVNGGGVKLDWLLSLEMPLYPFSIKNGTQRVSLVLSNTLFTCNIGHVSPSF